MELDPIYVDTAIRRWQRYTGDAAVHAVAKTPFDSVQKKLGTIMDERAAEGIEESRHDDD